MTEEKNHDCNQCGAKPGERHREWDDLARCRSTGNQLIQCEGELHEHNGREYGEHEGPCGPDIWDGEYPGVKFCRRMEWFTDPTSIYGEGEDLNFLASAHAQGLIRWDPDTEDYALVADKDLIDAVQRNEHLKYARYR